MKMTFWILGTAAIIAVISFVFGKTAGVNSSPISKDIPYGPFVIRVDATTGKTFNANYGMVGYTNVSYSVWYEGKPVPFPEKLQTNTGLPFLWRVYALPDAPEPTLLAGSQSLYLIYLKNGQPVVQPVHEQGNDFASVQFLDSETGQPGQYAEVFMKNDSDGLDQLDTLKGGRFLLISERVVLDVQTRQSWLFNPNNNAIDNYSFPQPHGALAFSPDRKQIIFNAGFQSWNTQTEDLPDSEHALVVYDFEKDKGYAVKYDDTDTRMKSMSDDIHLDWFNTYFEWQKDGHQLQLKKWDKLPNWTGKYKESDNYYHLYPVKAEMLPVFMDFVLKQMGWTQANILKDETAVYSGRTIQMGSGETKLDIVFRADEQEISFSKDLYGSDSPEYKVIVQKITKAFDAELLAGKHQEHFGRIMSETQRIDSL